MQISSGLTTCVRRCATLLLGGLLLSMAGSAAVLFELSTLDTGTLPGGTAPYLTANIEDSGANEVLVKLAAPGLVFTPAVREFVTKWGFNLDPALAPNFGSASITVVPVTTLAGGYSVSLAANAQDLSPSKNYDLLFSFETANNGNRFEQPDSFAVRIAMTGITANSFLFFNNLPVNSNNGTLAYSYAHIQGMAREASGKVYTDTWGVPPQEQIPEPSTYAMLAGGLGVLAFMRRRLK